MGHAFFQGNSVGELFYAFSMSDWLGKFICVLLLLISAGSCSLVVEKIISLRSALKKSKDFLQQLLASDNLFELQRAAKDAATPAGEVYLAAVRRFKSFDAVLPDKTCRPLTEKEIDLLRTAMERGVENQLLLLEKCTMLLASAVGVCPFLGLFGTVWGITMAFPKIAQVQGADIHALAPGVSGALLTTVFALIAVIPAMLGSNCIVSLLKKIATHLDDAVEEITARFQTEFMQQGC